eukprot:m.19605 g.19605  ORF g.19605 m.19605 type:complete len:176 (+) comp6628_c0_seq1:239-766(+)
MSRRTPGRRKGTGFMKEEPRAAKTTTGLKSKYNSEGNGNSDLELSREEYALLQSIHEMYRIPAVARGFVTPLCSDGNEVEMELPERPKTRSGRNAAWSQTEAETVALARKLASGRGTEVEDKVDLGKNSGTSQEVQKDANTDEIEDLVQNILVLDDNKHDDDDSVEEILDEDIPC